MTLRLDEGSGLLFLDWKKLDEKMEKFVKQLATFWKKVRLRQILSIFLAGIALFVTTACNSGNLQGARPENPPVQAGGMNNPYKGGGDGYSNYNQSTDPGVNSKTVNQERDRADLQLIPNQIVALNNDSELLYPGTETTAGNTSPQNIDQPKPGGLIQREPNLGERIGDRVEIVKEAFQDAGSFLKEKGNEAQARPELQPNEAKR